MPNQSNLELKEKAKKYVKEKRWDYLLAHAYLKTMHFYAWSKKEEFEEKWNIELTNIASEKRLLECGYVKKEIEFLVADYKDISFKIGGYKDYGDLITLSLSLFIQDKVVLSVRYFTEEPAAYFANDYKLIDFE